MRLFLDTSVLLSASNSATGASREIFRRAATNGWVLVTTPYAVQEVLNNLPDFPPSGSAEWAQLRPGLLIMDDVYSIDWPVVFPAGKDRPILFGALAWADILITLDRGDFGGMMEKPFYGLPVLTPGDFLRRERTGRAIALDSASNGAQPLL